MILLASKSSGRLATLRAAGIEPLVRVSDVDEGAVLEELSRRRREAGLRAPSAAEQVQALARAKALDVAASTDPQEAEVVVGCDSMLEIGSQVVGKPADAADARERWRTMSGSTGTLHTGHFLVRTADGAIAEGVSSATIRSPSTAWAGPSLRGSTATPTESSASPCRCYAGSWRTWTWSGQTYGRRHR